MKIIINGETRDCTSPLTLSELIHQMNMKSDRVAVELNRNIIPREKWTQIQLADNDHLEIVQFVGGGLQSPKA